MHLSASPDDRWFKISASFAVILLLLGAYFNFEFTYARDIGTMGIVGMWILWSLMFLPAIVLPLRAGWSSNQIGFGLGWAAVITSAGFVALLFLVPDWRHLSWPLAAREAFARTGEEAFFRGFLFTLFWRSAREKPRPWVRAIVGSSLAFVLVHTQTFQPGGIIDQGVFPAISRLINLFLFAAVLNFVRWQTDSILPGALVHSTFNGGLETIPFVLVLYAIGRAWCKVCTLGRADDKREPTSNGSA